MGCVTFARWPVGWTVVPAAARAGSAHGAERRARAPGCALATWSALPAPSPQGVVGDRPTPHWEHLTVEVLVRAFTDSLGREILIVSHPDRPGNRCAVEHLSSGSRRGTARVSHPFG